MIKILHTGDIHLDSPFSRLDTARAEIRRNELRAAFTSMMTYVRVNHIDILLIAGDLFDSDFVTRETIGIILREFERCQAEVFIAAGNHDPITPDSVYAKEGIFPENVHIFKSDELEKFSLDELGVDVYGYSFTSDRMYHTPFEGKHVEDEDRFNILLAHGDTRSSSSVYCPVTESLICDFGADYTALGHIHNAAPIKEKDGCVYGYCGCLEGRDFGETGVKGAVLIEADKSDGKTGLSVKKIRFSRRRYECENLDVEGAETQSEIAEKIRQFISDRGYGEETLLSLTLKGRVSASLVINTDILASQIEGLFFFELSDGTVPGEDASELEGDITIKGQFYRELLPMLESENEEEKQIAQAALRYGLSALDGENVVDF
ncbi:MAG: DNA repair exonuclease [Ruminococcaceae bacterium]|nr:DNA repair exonuclease [Oscillospiraceae bacterium]